MHKKSVPLLHTPQYCIHSRTVVAYVHYTADYRPKNNNRVNKILICNSENADHENNEVIRQRPNHQIKL